MDYKVVYSGLCEIEGHKIGYKYNQLDPDDKVTNEYFVFKKPRAIHAIGQVLILKSEDGQKFGMASELLPLEVYSQQQKINIAGNNQALKLRLQSVRSEKANAKKNEIHDILKPLQKMYRETNYQNRQYIIAQIIEYITR